MQRAAATGTVGAWPTTRRDETKAERLDRNWNDMLQELRVVQTGVQLLSGFLLTLPFTERFGDIDVWQQRLYLALVLTWRGWRSA